MPFRFLERRDHVVDDRRARQDIALRRRELPAPVARPYRRFRSRVGGVLAFQVHDSELTPLLAPLLGQRIGIVLQNLLDDVLRRHLLPQQIERLRPVADVDDRLRRGHAGVGVGPQHAVAG